MTEVEKEINDQKVDLEKVFSHFWEDRSKEKVAKLLERADVVYLIGCGSSYYVSISAAKYLTQKTGMEAKAIPGGEIVFYDQSNLSRNLKKVAFLISRSGESTEVVKAVHNLKKYGIPTIGVTLDEKSSLAKITDIKIVIPLIEKSVVMTKGFTSMLLTLQLEFDYFAGEKNEDVYKEIFNKMDQLIQNYYQEASKEELLASHLYVFLGMGPYEGIARESALKLEEMALVKTEAYSTFEYRHGPKSLVEKGVSIIIFESGQTLKEEEKLKAELENYGGMVLMNKKLTDGPEDLFARVIFSQILGLKIAERKGVDVEKPRNLTKVVVL
ncbi:MAG TPA: iron dicitrate transport regulator FecR [Pseudothermotoga sp.]|nr:iron dicitrate transport regulator FecR [Pseudothermotoga sp.]